MTSQYDKATEAMLLERAAKAFDEATQKRLVFIGGQLKPMYVVIVVHGGVEPLGPDPATGAAPTVYVPVQVLPLVTTTWKLPLAT